jgi:hypothetical protein
MACAPAAPRALMASVAMADLRTELNRHREGEDGCIPIERQRERHHNLEGRNLKKDFNPLVPAQEAPIAHAMHTSSSPAATGGCMAHGGLAVQVSTPSIREIQGVRHGQPLPHGTD